MYSLQDEPSFLDYAHAQDAADARCARRVRRWCADFCANRLPDWVYFVALAAVMLLAAFVEGL